MKILVAFLLLITLGRQREGPFRLLQVAASYDDRTILFSHEGHWYFFDQATGRAEKRPSGVDGMMGWFVASHPSRNLVAVAQGNEGRASTLIMDWSGKPIITLNHRDLLFPKYWLDSDRLVLTSAKARQGPMLLAGLAYTDEQTHIYDLKTRAMRDPKPSEDIKAPYTIKLVREGGLHEFNIVSSATSEEVYTALSYYSDPSWNQHAVYALRDDSRSFRSELVRHDLRTGKDSVVLSFADLERLLR